MRQAVHRPSQNKPSIIRQLSAVIRYSLFAVFLVISAGVLICFLTYHPEDPGWSSAVQTETIENWFGAKGALFSDIAFMSLGKAAYIFPLLLGTFAYQLFVNERIKHINIETILIRLFGILLLILSCAGLLDIVSASGGAIGNWIGSEFTLLALSWFGKISNNQLAVITAGKVFLALLILISLVMVTGRSPLYWSDYMGKVLFSIFNVFKNENKKKLKNLGSIEKYMKKDNSLLSSIKSLFQRLFGRPSLLHKRHPEDNFEPISVADILKNAEEQSKRQQEEEEKRLNNNIEQFLNANKKDQNFRALSPTDTEQPSKIEAESQPFNAQSPETHAEMVTTENSSDSDYVPPVFYSQHDQANENKDSQQNRSHTAPSFSSNSSNNALKQHESNNHWANNSSSDKQTPTFSTHVNHSTKSKKVAPILSIPPKRQAKSATSASPNFRFGQVYKNDEIDQFSSEKPEPHFSPLDTPFDVELQSMDTQSIDSKSFEANANHNEQYETEFYESHFSTTLEEEHDFPKMEEKELTESASVTFAPITPITAESEIYPSSFSFSSATDNISLNTDEFDPISEANMDRIIDTAEITSEDDNDSRMDSSDSFHADNDLTFPESSTQFSAIDQQETTPAMNSAPAFSFVAPQKEHQEPTFHAPRTDEATKSHHDKQEPTLASPPKPMGYDVDSRSGMPIPKKPKKEFPMLGQLPSPNLLGDPPPSSDSYNKEELNEMAAQIEEQLKHFNVEVTVANIEPGPVITRFELDLAPGVKVAQINNLSKDIARALSVTSVRVVDIIPGKPYVGLEIPNSNRETVYFKEGLFSPEYREATHPLTIILGKDISGRHIIANLAKMPHLLVAGTTGSGKSVGINTMLLSLLFKAHPDELRLILIDPKMLELSVYNDIPHLLSPVVTDMKESANALRWCVAEMERRYLLMSNLKVRNIAGFNKKVKEAIENDEPLDNPLWRREDQVSDYVEAPTLEPLPYIVVVIDEFADMMMLVGKKCEELIARLAQKARASGIHLILATQRPSVDVITGLIKANIPTRISFQVSSRIDSRTIIDQQGAETLLGHGDMLYLPPGNPIPIRVHGAFIDDHEVNKVVEFLKLTGDTDYIEDILKDPTEPIPGLSEKAAGVAAAPDDSTDVLFDEAVRIVVEDQRASISYVQRRLRVGYQRAARLIEEMERQGFISAPEANGSRDVLIARYEADDDGQ